MSKNKVYSRYFLLLFILVSIVDIAAICFGNYEWQTYSKPLIIPALAAYYITSSAVRNSWYIGALFFSFLGDVLLLDKHNLFLYGIAAFLVTQVLYIYLFSKGLKSNLKQKSVAGIPFLIFFTTLIWILKPGLQEYFIPVVIYGITISIFGAVSLLRYLSESNRANLYLIVGAVLFIISDSMIAMNKFYEAQDYYPVAIMLTYIAAQLLIAIHVVKTEKVPG